jgi:hypothetical protein
MIQEFRNKLMLIILIHREKVRSKYLENGPCQPGTCNFLVTIIGDKPRRFNPEFDEF